MGKLIDLTGKRFGKWIVKSYVGWENHMAMWNCVCDCGKERAVSSGNLRSGISKSCGCSKIGSRTIDLTGKMFGRLLVESQASNIRGRTAWNCVCSCKDKTRKVVTGTALVSGNTSSCGCYSKEQARERRLSHGEADTRMYKIWQCMKDRCENSHNKNYPHYGGRGIKVCEEWKSFKPFFDWSLSNGYSDSLTIERLDNDKGYSPDNCTWATRVTQGRNRRVSIVNTSGIAGVSRKTYKNGKQAWQVDITVNNKKKYIGVYNDLEMAAEARKQAEAKYWGK